jgi:hypothetical protein
MAASYPGAVRPFVNKTNVVDIIDAAHPNSLQEEVVAIESTIGLNPALSTAPSPSGTFSATATQYTTLVQRLANIETGIVADVHTQYVRKTGNETIVNGTSTNVALVIKGAASQSANLLEWRNSSNTLLASVSASGVLSVPSVSAPETDHALLLGILGS